MTLDREASTRSWLAVIQFPGKKKCLFGNVFCRVDAPLAEVEEEARRVVLEHVPEGFEILDLVPGMFIPIFLP